MTGSFSVKLKSKNGQFIVKDLELKTTLHEFKRRVSEATCIHEDKVHILIGFPPRPLDLSLDAEKRTLQTCGIQKGDTLIVEEKLQPSTSAESSSASKPKETVQAIEENNMGEKLYNHLQMPSLEDDEALARRLQAEEQEELERLSSVNQVAELQSTGNEQDRKESRSNLELSWNAAQIKFNGVLLKRVVPADNSCLFTSVRFVLNGKLDNEGSEAMRCIIAQEVAADPQQYNDAVLGKSNSEYCTWIKKTDSWGGAIEVAILSKYYGVEIDVVDIQNAIINRFGEDKNYPVRVFLLFDGIHYDPLYMETDVVIYMYI